jgi:predicted pyridoxine 5'-phosphate oxidase superfamily flavin-nucleotide-binding protein
MAAKKKLVKQPVKKLYRVPVVIMVRSEVEVMAENAEWAAESLQGLTDRELLEFVNKPEMDTEIEVEQIGH